MTARVGWTARRAVVLATALIAPGRVRDRYRGELLAELSGLDATDQLARSASMLRGAPALHRALVETGAVPVPHAPWWCTLRLHHRWTTTSTPDGGRFRHCRDCGADDDETGLGDLQVTSYRVATEGWGS